MSQLLVPGCLLLGKDCPRDSQPPIGEGTPDKDETDKLLSSRTENLT